MSTQETTRRYSLAVVLAVTLALAGGTSMLFGLPSPAAVPADEETVPGGENKAAMDEEKAEAAPGVPEGAVKLEKTSMVIKMGKAPEPDVSPDKAYFAVIRTNKGDITLRLFPDAAPVTVTSFINLARNGLYNGSRFHRVITDFMAQGGILPGAPDGGPGYRYPNEISATALELDKEKVKDATIVPSPTPEQMETFKDRSLEEYYTALGFTFTNELPSRPMVRGALAMANAGPNTNSSQFFIVTTERSLRYLEGKHTVFGEVVEGMKVVDSLKNGDKMETVEIYVK